MYKITCTGPRGAIEAAWSTLAWADPSPADAVDAKEETRSLWRLDAYAKDAEAAQACARMIAETEPGLFAVVEALEDRDWVKLSLEGLPAIEVGRFRVAGDHALAKGTDGKTPLLIEAGPAFGTGHHGTTLGCLEAFDRVLRHRRPCRVLDLGTGTGLLAIAALKSGADFALATDIDRDSVITARENGIKNDVGRRYKVIEATGTLSASIQRQAPFDLVFANILARPLIGLAPGIAAVAAPGSHIILSGLLRHQEPSVRSAYDGRGLMLTSRIHRDGWSTLVYRRPQRAGQRVQCAARRSTRLMRRASSRGRLAVLPVGTPVWP